MHIPVLLQKTLEYLQPRNGGRYIDATAGQGGHLREILKHIGARGRVMAIDWDPVAIAYLKSEFASVARNGRCMFVQGNFAHIKEYVVRFHMGQLDGVLFDFGLSRATIEESGKGFSFQKNEPLVMTYGSDVEQTAEDVVNNTPERELADIIFQFGEDRLSRRIAHAIVLQRQRHRITMTSELVACVMSAYPPRFRHGRIHPATKTFQAIRIVVNKELENISRALPDALDMLCLSGRIVALSYHSLEDRIVKNVFQDASRDHQGLILTKKPITPLKQEKEQNPSSRSAKLRAFEKK